MFVDMTHDCFDASFEQHARALSVPIRDMSQQDFHEILARQCPNLADLTLSLRMPVSPSGKSRALTI